MTYEMRLILNLRSFDDAKKACKTQDKQFV